MLTVIKFSYFNEKIVAPKENESVFIKTILN